MANLCDFVKDATPRESELLKDSLREGEYIRWATRTGRWYGVRDVLGVILLELVAASLWAPALLSLALTGRIFSPPWLRWEIMLYVLPLFLLFFLPGVLLTFVPWLRWYRRRNTLCVLTNHRALVAAPAYFSRWTLQSYPLHEDMLYARICRPGGGGDLLFTPGASGGFTHLPDLHQAHHELNAAIHAHQNAAERLPESKIYLQGS